MNVALIDVDSHNFPNLCLMKISAWHKLQGDMVELVKPADILNGQNLFRQYDVMYAACVFDWNRETAERLAAVGAIVGGSGTGNKERLEYKVEHIMPDYSLYGITDTAYGFLTRGCPRRCPFCIVAGKEGAESRKVADLSEWWDGQKNIKLLDPNLLAYVGHMNLLEQLADSGAWVDITQGFDARLLTAANVDEINRMKIKYIHFAWDNPRDESIKKNLLFFAERNGLRNRQRLVYVLTNYWSTHEEDLERVYWLRENGYDPYVMIYDKAKAPRETRLLQRWVNNKMVFWSTERFEDFDEKIA